MAVEPFPKFSFTKLYFIYLSTFLFIMVLNSERQKETHVSLLQRAKTLKGVGNNWLSLGSKWWFQVSFQRLKEKLPLVTTRFPASTRLWQAGAGNCLSGRGCLSLPRWNWTLKISHASLVAIWPSERCLFSLNISFYIFNNKTSLPMFLQGENEINSELIKLIMRHSAQ